MKYKKPINTALKMLLGLFVYGLTIAVVFTAFAFWWGTEEFKKPGPVETARLFEVQRGDHVNKIAGQLYAEDFIYDPFIFMIGVTLSGAQSAMKAGEYEIQPRMSAAEIMVMMRDGDTHERRFTIPEGLTSFEIVRYLGTLENLSGEIEDIPVEGVLLPNTYNYRQGEPRKAILQRLEQEMESTILIACNILLEKEAGTTLKDLLDMECGTAPAPLKTIGEVLTLASIVEKETGKPEERRKVAGVFINRLRKGIALQTDPTVIYAITGGKHKNDGKGPLGRRLLKKDLEIDSPYNTYKYPGLPPGPIANPGRASIEAVFDPEEHEFIYFVADGTGGHAFAKTLNEHNNNVAKWRKIRKKSGQ